MLDWENRDKVLMREPSHNLLCCENATRWGCKRVDYEKMLSTRLSSRFEHLKQWRFLFKMKMTKILKIMMKWHFWFFGDLICSFSARRHHQISHSIYFQWHSQPYFLTQPSIVMMTLSDIFFQPYSKSIFNQLAPSVQWHSHPYFLISSRIKTSLGHFCFALYSSPKVW